MKIGIFSTEDECYEAICNGHNFAVKMFTGNVMCSDQFADRLGECFKIPVQKLKERVSGFSNVLFEKIVGGEEDSKRAEKVSEMIQKCFDEEKEWIIDYRVN